MTPLLQFLDANITQTVKDYLRGMASVNGIWYAGYTKIVLVVSRVRDAWKCCNS